MEPLAEQLRRCAAELPAVQLAVLFGSTARRRTRRDSDVDVGVLLEPTDLETRQAVEVALGEVVSRAAGRDLDFVMLDSAPPLLRFQVTRHGELLFEREPGTWTRFKVRAWRDWWDWKPYARMIQDAAIADLKRKAAADG